VTEAVANGAFVAVPAVANGAFAAVQAVAKGAFVVFPVARSGPFAAAVAAWKAPVLLCKRHRAASPAPWDGRRAPSFTAPTTGPAVQRGRTNEQGTT
jgi:hypothetical protein